MRATIQSTSQMAEVNGVPARIWEGVTEQGIPFFAYITRVAVREDRDCSQFDRELTEHKAPSREANWIPLKYFLD
jgi:hypothetical protein